LTDGQGRTVDFSHAIIIMTSNVGGSVAGEENDDKPRAPIGFGVTQEKKDDGYDYKVEGMGFGAKVTKTPKAVGGPKDERQKKYLDAFKKKYRPEFVNRVGEDRVIVFNEITDAAKLGAILDLRLKALESQLKEKRLTVTLTPAAREAALAKARAQSRYGARPIKQIVDREINRALKDAELEGRIADGDAVSVDWNAAQGRYVAGRALIR
ncbi:MAG: ATP-dependent Clp protease ATP-binding subunit, partial [Elusimicrobia bacterium]|nr:ATP-dependent Clp protease ATP-binding subunit [Elusimicrobiota bacterium]